MKSIDELSLCEFIQILFVLTSRAKIPPFKHSLVSKILIRLKDEPLAPKCLKDMRSRYGEEVEETFYSLRASWCVEIIMPSCRDYVDKDLIEAWRDLYRNQITELGEFVNKIELTVKDEIGKLR